jgi:WS/DGAT/MGAT family acyltransferase
MQRLTAGDLNTLWPDDAGWPQDIGAVAILDAGRLPRRGGAPDLSAIRRVISSRLHRVPRFRQRIHFPHAGLGWPLWVDSADFDIAHHVDVWPGAAPGDEKRLLEAVEHLRRRPLDRSRPLWEIWLISGLPDGRAAVYIKVHHAIADGASGVAILGALLDEEPHADVPSGPPFMPAPPPSVRALFVDNVRRRLRDCGRALSALLRPARTARRIRAGWPAVRETMASGRAPRTSLNTRIGPHRTFVLVRTRLNAVRAIGLRYGATVNDVLLTVVAGGLRELLRRRGEHVEGVVLRAYVPVSLHRGPGQAEGNHDGLMVASLPVGEADPAVRLGLIAAETGERRRRRRPPAGALLRNGLMQRALLSLMGRQRWANTYVANVAGPREPLHLAGAPLLELFPVVPLIGNITLGVGALSYAGQFNIVAVADRDACGDVEVFAEGARETLRSLTPRDAPAAPVSADVGA